VSRAESLPAAIECLHDWLGARIPEVGLVLGSGLGDLTRGLENARRLEYSDIPGFPRISVAGHSGAFVSGTLGRKEVLCQCGRVHLYEGHGAELAVLPVRALAALGVRVLCLTNAAGGIRPGLDPGALMLITDHLNLTSHNALIGPSLPGELHFPDMSDPYDANLRALAHAAALDQRIPLEEGVYAGVMGPSYETVAEIAALRRLGADAVGMSTVLEVTVARAAGVRCLGVSIITNRAAGLGAGRLSHQEVLDVAGHAEAVLGRLLADMVQRLPRGGV